MSKKPSTIATASLSGASGTFQDPQLDCEAFGGTLATGIDEFGAFWTCGPLPLGDPITGILGDDCFTGGGDQFGYAGFGHPEDAYVCLFDGTFQDPQLDCEAFGGTFATGIDEFGAFWTCGPLPLGDPITGILGDDCFAGGGDQFGYAGFGHPEDAYVCLFD